VIASIETQLGGKAEFDWKPEGLVCRLSVPLSRNALPREASHHPSHLANGRAVEPALRRA
jgi:hypothetical protein